MSAIQMKTATLEVYQGSEGFIYKEDKYIMNYPKEVENQNASIFTPERYGLGVTGILSIVAILILLALSYSMLALLFVVPLIGVAMGFAYIEYVEKHGKFQ